MVTPLDTRTTVSSEPNTQNHALPRGYVPLPDGYDELVATGEVRPQWNEFIRMLGGLGTEEFARRRAQAAKLIEENGVTYNVYGDPEGVNRPWAMDLLPQILAPEDWPAIEAGLKQRAVLLNLILSDLYGAQTLLKEGRVPPEFVFANPAFLRPCHGLTVPYDRFLHFYAADLTRGADEQWMVIADRTQAPSGAGYALENRIVLSRVFPNIIHDCRVRRLASYFDRARGSLRDLAPHNRENPNIVLLSPGPFNETYFEHSYLARYLGFTLVEGEDLAVRDNCVFLKTLEGLERVDVILRRIDDYQSDPLEFHGESTIGLVGLLQAVHSGNVAVANALGSGVMEAPVLRALLPPLCRILLGEDLKLPSPRTWWCVDPEDRAYVIDHLEELVILTAFPSRRAPSVTGAELNQPDREALRNAILARPYAYGAQAPGSASTVPVWTDAGWKPRCMVYRAYAVAAAADDLYVMPGGLTRFSESTDRLALAMQRGGGSKDTWVLADGPIEMLSLLPQPGQPIEIKRAVTNLPSRAADNLYWLGRYLERAEGTARRIRCVLTRMTDEISSEEEGDFPHFLRTLAEGFTPRSEGVSNIQGLEQVVMSAVFDSRRGESVQATFGALHRVAWVVRDRLSTDAWRILSRLIEDLPDEPFSGPTTQPGELLLLLNHLIGGLASFSGLTMENMTRGQGYRFLDIGRRIERSVHTLGLLRAGLANTGPAEGTILQAVLEISDSALTYRSRYGANLQTPAVLDLLLTDESNPRSLVFQMEALTGHLMQLPREKAYPFLSAEQQILTGAVSELRLLDIFALSESDTTGARTKLHTLLSRWLTLLPEMSDALARHYFSHTGTPRPLTAKVGDAQP